MSNFGHSLREARIRDSMRHPDELGEGAKRRVKLSPRDRRIAVMREYRRGTLHSGSGDIVTRPSQAVAIGIHESRRKNA